eukprot:1759856-Prorocentrum_lima.AAC.1
MVSDASPNPSRLDRRGRRLLRGGDLRDEGGGGHPSGEEDQPGATANPLGGDAKRPLSRQGQ